MKHPLALRRRKTPASRPWLISPVIAGLDFLVAEEVTAQTFTNLHNFTGSDGTSPQARVILSGNTLYGTTFFAGGVGAGTVFGVNADGTGFRNLHSFDGTNGGSPLGLILSGDTLYGAAWDGGDSVGCCEIGTGAV